MGLHSARQLRSKANRKSDPIGVIPGSTGAQRSSGEANGRDKSYKMITMSLNRKSIDTAS